MSKETIKDKQSELPEDYQELPVHPVAILLCTGCLTDVIHFEIQSSAKPIVSLQDIPGNWADVYRGMMRHIQSCEGIGIDMSLEADKAVRTD